MKNIIEKENTGYNNAYSLWRVNGYQQGFLSVASFGFSGQESASKPPQAICKPLGIIRETLRNNIKILLITLLTFQFGCSQNYTLNFKISTNYLDGIPNLTKIKTIENTDSKINVYFFKEHFAQFYGLPNELTNENLKGQEITEWEFKDRPKELSKNWTETYKYDSEGKLIEYKYSGCTICSQFPWGYKLIYNQNNDIIEQQVYYLEQKIYAEKDGLKVKHELKEEMERKINLTYDNNGNIIKFEKIGKNGLEELIELME